jgi:hypothetical protein
MDRIPPHTVLAFMSKNPRMLPSIPNYGDYSAEADIERARVVLAHDKKRRDVYSKMTGIKAISESRLVEIVKAAQQPKYRSRDSPPFPANKLCGSTVHGNDKQLYVSVKNAGVCTWRKTAAHSKMATRRLRRSKMVCQRISRKNSKLPPFVAATCPGMRKKGKDRMYVSSESANGVWAWI